MDLEGAADDLYAASPDDFIAQRKGLVTQARHAGDRELARQITQLRRPTRTGWLVNVLAREAADEVSGLLELGAALAQAQQRRSGDDLRRLSQQRRTTVDALAKKAVALGRDRGYAAPEAAVQEVAQTLQSALGDPAVAELVRRGHLTQSASYGGFGPADLTAALAASTPRAAPAPEAEPEPEPEETPQDDREQRELAEHAAATRTAWEQARGEAETAEADAELATQEADDLADRVETLRAELRETEEAERQARSHARVTRKLVTELRQGAAVAEQVATDAAAALSPP